MSIFFGIFRPQGGPVDPEAFEDMRKASEREGFDSMRVHVEDKIAVGHLMLRVSPEDEYDEQPLKSSCGRYLLVGHFRLDYRDELGDKIGLTQTELEKTSDSKLVMMSFQKWGEDCVYHIEGDWSLAVYDYLLNKIHIVKDQTGYSALYYYNNNGSLYFSSDVNIIQAIRTISFEIEMTQFFRMSLIGVMLENGFTLMKNLFHLKAGHSVSFDEDLIVDEKFYWTLDMQPKRLFIFDEDYAHSMFSVFSLAVKSRLRSSKQTGIFLSAGLDSTAVASLASSELSAKKKSLFSYTSFPAHLDLLSESEIAFADETILLDPLMQRYKNIVPSYLNFKDFSLSSFFASDITKDAYSPIVTTNTFWIRGILEKASEYNVKLFLNGQMGNFTISHAAPFLYPELFSKLKFKPVLGYLIKIRKLTGLSFFYILKSRLFKPLLTQLKSFLNFCTLFSKKYFNSLTYIDPGLYPKKKLRLQKSWHHFIPGYYFIRSSRSLRLAQIDRNIVFSAMIWYKVAAEFGLLITDPTSDKRVLEYSLLIPEDQFNKNGVIKYLYKNMMRGLLPSQIIDNRKVLTQSYDFGLRMKYDDSFNSFIEQIANDHKLNDLFQVQEFSIQYHSIINSNFPHRNRLRINEFLLNLSLLSFFRKKNN